MILKFVMVITKNIYRTDKTTDFFWISCVKCVCVYEKVIFKVFTQIVFTQTTYVPVYIFDYYFCLSELLLKSVCFFFLFPPLVM